VSHDLAIIALPSPDAVAGAVDAAVAEAVADADARAGAMSCHIT
jgi:hypothetical protein